MADHREPGPPDLPDIPRGFHLAPAQSFGFGVLLLIPLLALFGLLGEARTTRDGRTAELVITIDYPIRYRYSTVNDLQLDVTNTTARVLDRVTVDLDTEYAAHKAGLERLDQVKWGILETDGVISFIPWEAGSPGGQRSEVDAVG